MRHLDSPATTAAAKVSTAMVDKPPLPAAVGTAAAAIAGRTGDGSFAPIDTAAILLLDDPLNVSIVLTWHLVPAAIRTAESLYDMASYSSRVAGCDLDVAVARLHTLLGLGVLLPNGTVDPTVVEFLRRKGQARVVGAASGDPARIVESHLAGLSPAQLAELLNRAAPEQVKALTWDEDDEE